MKQVKVWDPLVRLFHWALVLGIVLNGLILDDEGKLHNWVGYGVVALVAVRVIWGMIGSKHARFSSFPPNFDAALEQMQDIALGRVKAHAGHTPLGALMIYNLLLSSVMAGVTGYMMSTVMFWGTDWVEELHEVIAGWIGFSVLVHVAAVVFESWRSGVNLPLSMITGRKNLPSSHGDV